MLGDPNRRASKALVPGKWRVGSLSATWLSDGGIISRVSPFYRRLLAFGE